MVRTDVRVSAIILRGNKILLIHRKKNGEEYWVFPGGGVEDNETADEGILREVKEETNLDVLKCELACMAYNEAAKKEEPFYLCEVSEGEPEIVGEEKDKHSPDNWYHLEWIELTKIKDVWLVPEKAVEEVVKKYLELEPEPF